jgi:hypothetical protein
MTGHYYYLSPHGLHDKGKQESGVWSRVSGWGAMSRAAGPQLLAKIGRVHVSGLVAAHSQE